MAADLITRIPQRAARWSAEHPWRAILTWLFLVLAATSLAVLVPTHEAEDADYRIGESGRADAMAEKAGLTSPDTEVVLLSGDRAQLPDAAREVARRMTDAEGVSDVAPPIWNDDRTAMLVSVALADGVDDVAPLQDVTAKVAAEHPDLSVRQTGGLSLDEDINDQVADDLSSAEGISLPVTLVLMLLAFGALIAAGIPVLLALGSVAATMGISAVVSHLVPAEPTVGSMIVLIGMAVGVDYSLFYLKREREERARGRSTLDAVEIAAQTSGHSILVSGFAVAAAMSGLFLVDFVTFTSLAMGAIIVVAVAVLGSITVLPALLVKLGRWVDRPRVPLLWRLNRRIGAGGISRRILAPVVRHPALALAGSVAAATALAVPALGMTMHASNLETLPAGIPAVETMRDVAAEFPGEGTTVTVLAQGDGSAQALDDLASSATDFTAVPGGVTTSDDGSTSSLTLALPWSDSDQRTTDAITDLREDLAPASLDGLEWAVGGDAASNLDFDEHLSSWMPVVIGFVLLLTLVMMGVAFRSVPLALVSTALNLVSVGVAFGVLTLVFQHGWLEDALGFTSTGFVIDWIPLFVLVVLVGLSMDYHVFVTGRIRELVGRGLPTKLAVEQGIRDSASVVTSAAAVMVSVFAIFATLSMLEMKMMGVALSVAILLDATIIRLVMLPAALVLLGDRVWWPRRPAGPTGEVVDVRVEEPELTPVA
ncbi:RND superfamily putative drug exporter [Nocardioides sp. BE266]|uniref:MMPL family transporter n=1 Tax=Nocardioides sp. BE266 TaxID=2817725 RepID=UPI002854C3CB|nr:MMPL family transporter [Nocardioides sp. BE266]MDR7253199.1 RND superfamily putative drug exporter [Nocardioides sp. BE266]